MTFAKLRKLLRRSQDWLAQPVSVNARHRTGNLVRHVTMDVPLGRATVRLLRLLPHPSVMRIFE